MVEIPLGTRLKYYKRPEIQKAIVAAASQREVAVRFGESFGKRPDVLQYEGEILELVKQGATSFHVSEELWQDPMQLNASLHRKQLDDLRVGWDLVLDIDCPQLEYSGVAAHLVI